MSGFVGASQPNSSIGLQDLRLNRPDFREIWSIALDGQIEVEARSFQTDWWPGSGLMGDLGADVGLLAPALAWSKYYSAFGASSRFGFVGVTRNANGTPVAACTVKLFRTADDLLLDTQVSDANGAFLLNTPYYPDAHYIVAHKTASPDIDGASVNTLVGT